MDLRLDDVLRLRKPHRGRAILQSVPVRDFVERGQARQVRGQGSGAGNLVPQNEQWESFSAMAPSGCSG